MREKTRRQFLAQSGAAIAGACVLPSFVFAESKPAVRFPSNPRARISIASYSFRNFIVGPESNAANQPMQIKDFGAHVMDKFNVNKIEPWSRHFASTDPKYLEDFRNTMHKAGAAVANMSVDGDQSLYAADKEERLAAIAFTTQWIDIAATIGSPSIRRNVAQAKDSAPAAGRLAESLQRVVEHAAAKNVVVHLENDNDVSEDPFFLLRVIKQVDSPWLHALPDFGNTLSTHDDDYEYRGLDALFTQAYGICHVKETVGTDQGQTKTVDLARAFGILKKHNYKGYCSMEYDSAGDPYAPTAKLVADAVRLLA
jgi:sugar phosphate isomerase/epimerase